jgi:predicted metal-dependent phosphoesterase TrpH
MLQLATIGMCVPMIDLHTHSNESDGLLSPEELICKAVQSHLNALAITDHDTLVGYEQASLSEHCSSLELVCGIEISAKDHGRSVHVLGYFLEADPGVRFRNWLVDVQRVRHLRNLQIIKNLQFYGCDVSLEEIQSVGSRIVGRPHLAKLLVLKGYASSQQDAFARYLAEGACCYEGGAQVELSTALSELSLAGGLSILAHPDRLNLESLTFETYLKILIEKGLKGLEAYHSEHSAEKVGYYRKVGERLGLAITGGSDFHGDVRPDRVLGRSSGGNLEIPGAVLENLHSYLQARGRRSPRRSSAVVVALDSLEQNSHVLARIGTRTFAARVRAIHSVLHGRDSGAIQSGDIGHLELCFGDVVPELADHNVQIALEDPSKSKTIATGVALGPRLFENRGVVVWFTGLSGAGKSTLAKAVATALRWQNTPTILLDGDIIRVI